MSSDKLVNQGPLGTILSPGCLLFSLYKAFCGVVGFLVVFMVADISFGF